MTSDEQKQSIKERAITENKEIHRYRTVSLGVVECLRDSSVRCPERAQLERPVGLSNWFSGGECLNPGQGYPYWPSAACWRAFQRKTAHLLGAL